MKLNKIGTSVMCSLSSLVVFADNVMAAGASEYLPDQGTSGDLLSWVKKILNFAIGMAALVSAAMLIFSGYMYITANGDEAKVGKATKSLTWAIVGLIICFISVMLVNFVLGNVVENQE